MKNMSPVVQPAASSSTRPRQVEQAVHDAPALVFCQKAARCRFRSGELRKRRHYPPTFNQVRIQPVGMITFSTVMPSPTSTGSRDWPSPLPITFTVAVFLKKTVKILTPLLPPKCARWTRQELPPRGPGQFMGRVGFRGFLVRVRGLG